MVENREEQFKRVLEILYQWTINLGRYSFKTDEEIEEFWKKLSSDMGLLAEYAYYHDNGKFLCRYNIDGYTMADIAVWQMDHFRAHMNRPDSIYRYDSDRLVYVAFETMLKMKDNPEEIKLVMSQESGTDVSGGWYIH